MATRSTDGTWSSPHLLTEGESIDWVSVASTGDGHHVAVLSNIARAVNVYSLDLDVTVTPPPAPEPPAPVRFDDVPPNTFFTAAVDWARAEGHTTGVGGRNVFEPMRSITRAEAITLMHRLALSRLLCFSGFVNRRERCSRSQVHRGRIRWAPRWHHGAMRTRLLALLVAAALAAPPLGTVDAGRAEAQAGPPDHVLVDLVPGAFYERAVRWLHGEGLTTGVQPGWYGPDRTITRAELMTLLWRMADAPTDAPPSGFPDVRRDAFYTRAVDWALHTGITTGVGQTSRFMPEAFVDRAQLVTMLWRDAGSRTGYAPAPFPDVVRSAYYARAVDWAHATGLTTGVGQTGRFQPHALLTRGQAATFLHRLDGEPAPRPPALPAYDSSVATVTAADLPHSWRAGCPVGPADLRRVTLRHIGFDGRPTTGHLVVHHDAVGAVDRAFRHMYDSRFPIQRITQVDEAGGNDDVAMAANLTTAFNCRRVTGGSGWSEHAYGRALDINPIQNPYISRTGQVLPPAGAAHVHRGFAPGVITEESAPVVGFAGQGWHWGGRWTSPKDYQHFSASGR